MVRVNRKRYGDILTRIGFDLVVTLLVVQGRSPSVFRTAEPRYEIINILKKEIELGTDIYIISARVGTVQTLKEARSALNRYGIPDTVPLLMQPYWNGVESAVQFKTGMIKLLGIDKYNGDSERIDATACKNAGIKFVSVGGDRYG